MSRYLGGTFVGEDVNGNRYFECRDPETIQCRERYVEYAKKRNDRDASQIPAEWHGWLHKTVEDPPTMKKSATVVASNPKFFQGHRENFTGTNKRYVPYSTTNPKIEAWNPPSYPPSSS